MEIKKDTSYGYEYNFKISKNMNDEEYEELTVEITLAEYRELLQKKTTTDYRHKELQNEIAKLKEENFKLKEDILKMSINSLRVDEELAQCPVEEEE